MPIVITLGSTCHADNETHAASLCVALWHTISVQAVAGSGSDSTCRLESEVTKHSPGPLLPLPGDHDKQQQQQKADPLQQEKQQQAQQQPEHGQQQHQLQEEEQQGLSKHPPMPIPVFKDDDFMDSVLGHDKRSVAFLKIEGLFSENTVAPGRSWEC